MSDKIVYSTGPGGPNQSPGPEDEKSAAGRKSGMKSDGVVRVQRESKGRGGKTVSVIYGLPLSGPALSSFAAKIKQKCGAGGTVKDGVVIIQGDKVDVILRLLADEGFKAKRAGG